MPSTRGCLLSFKQSRLFLSSTKAHLAVISAHLYPVIYSFLPMIYVVLCCDEALEGTKEHLCAPWRDSSLGTFLWDLLSRARPQPSPENRPHGSGDASGALRASVCVTKALQGASGKGRPPLAPLLFFSPKVRFNTHLNTIILIETYKSVLVSLVCIRDWSLA